MARETVEFSASVPKEEYDFFKDAFPQYGAVTWFINSVLQKFNEEVRKNPTSKAQVDKAVQEMLDVGRALQIAEGSASK